MKSKNKSTAWKPFSIMLLTCMVIFVVANITASQLMPTGYFSFIQNDRQATVQFLKAVKLLPEFNQLVAVQSNRYGQSLEDEVFSEEQNRQMHITSLESLLNEHPRARDVLYGLYLLYSEKGDVQTAKDYLRRAREIDPLIGKSY